MWKPIEYHATFPMLNQRPNVYLWRVFGTLRAFTIPMAIYRRWLSVKWHAPRLTMMTRLRPVYWASSSMDCDCVRSRWASKAANGWRYIRDIDSLYDHAEGPTSHWRITKRQYEEFESEWRDLGTEAHEDGHPHIVYS
jgi:hypothetical protein